MKSLLAVLISIGAMGCGLRYNDTNPPTPTTDVVEDRSQMWEEEIAALVAADESNPPPQNAFLFNGSSSIRLWTTLADDMSPWPIIRRGFGGAQLGDCTRYADEIVTPYNPRAIFVFCGTNDIAGDNPKQPAQVLELYKDYVAAVREKLPDTPIYFISVSPTRSRWEHVDLVYEANMRIKKYSLLTTGLHYIDTASALVDDKGPRDDLFLEDQLHLNADGYAAWTEIIRPVLERIGANTSTN